jgi:putative transposase
MRKAFVYRLYPTPKQADQLTWVLDRCRELYNAALEERRDAYPMAGKSLGYYEQKRELPGVKEMCPEYRQVGSQVLQDVIQRVERAFAAFFRRVPAGQTPRLPALQELGPLRRLRLNLQRDHNAALAILNRARLARAGV